MPRTPWSLAIIGLTAGGLAIVGGTTIGGQLGPLTAGYGVLVVLAALYAIVGLAVRERARRPRSEEASPAETLAGHRVF